MSFPGLVQRWIPAESVAATLGLKSASPSGAVLPREVPVWHYPPLGSIRASTKGNQMKRMKLVVAAVVAAATLAIPATAFADSCANVSRAPAPCGFTCTSPVVVGNSVWLPSIGVGLLAWGFAPPGTIDSIQAGFAGANGNYTNGQTSSLLGMSAICKGTITVRQTTNGIQTGCQ